MPSIECAHRHTGIKTKIRIIGRRREIAQETLCAILEQNISPSSTCFFPDNTEADCPIGPAGNGKENQN